MPDHDKNKNNQIEKVCTGAVECLKAATYFADRSLDRFGKQLERSFWNFPHWKIIGMAATALLLWFSGIYLTYFAPPADFPAGAVVRVKKGSTVSQAAADLAAHRLIKSPLAFKALSKLEGGNKIMAGDYRFERRSSVFTVLERLQRGVYGIETTKVTILEGHNNREVAVLLDRSLPAFEKDKFLADAEKYEGKLFPDTYFIKPMDDEEDIVKMMTDNFDKQITPFESLIGKAGYTRDEVITMASILELEARTAESRRIIAGILWNRLNRGMKLQVDAVFPYIMNKYSLALTVKDLQYDSPYNTYLYKGLPPGPIGNPGIEAIKAALEPKKTSCLYYLSDRNGVMHYATTYEEHMKNRRKYLANY